MNKYLKQLIALQQYDIQIDSFEPKIKEARSELDEILKKKEDIEKEIDRLSSEISDIDMKIRKNELHLKELSAKLDDISKKYAQIKSEKEIKALQLEEDITKEQCDFANEEIARLEKLKEQKNEEIQELKAKLEEIEQEICEIAKKTDEKLKEIEEEKKEVYKKKQELLEQMSQNIIIFYEKIRRWAGNTTVVEVKKQACYGCYMRINEQTYSDVIRGEEIITCPHCGRILYVDEESLKAQQEA